MDSILPAKVTPEWRAKPLGTVDALLAARPLLHQPFIVLNAVCVRACVSCCLHIVLTGELPQDCIYGEPTLRLVCEYLQSNVDENTACCPGFPLKVLQQLLSVGAASNSGRS
jgi:hypothetical protein